jgi:hypothetical protein
MFIDQKSNHRFPKITPIRLPKVLKLCNEFSLGHEYLLDAQELRVSYKRLGIFFKEWFAPLIDLSGFENIYFTNNGITQGIEYTKIFFNENIHLLKGDYFWLKNINAGIELNDLKECNISYMTNPSSIDGNVKNDIVWDSKHHVLDGAYVGTSIKKINVPNNTEIVLLGFSKNLGLPELRTGIIFSKNKIPLFEAFQNDQCYTSLKNFFIVEKICKEIGIVDLSLELKKLQEEYCAAYKEYGFIPSDSALMATTSNTEFSFYKRSESIIRIPLGESITKWIQNTHS